MLSWSSEESFSNIVGIQMGTNCAPLLADIIMYSYEAGFIQYLLSVGFGWLVVLRITVDLAIFQPYLDLEEGDNQSLKIQVARPGIEPWSSCSASQELNHSATAAPSLLERIS